MTINSLNRQSGMVLAFSLIMLILVSVISISMLQENSLQIRMVSNTGEQNQAFSNVEADLTQAESNLTALRRSAAADDTCVNPNQLSDGSVITGTSAQITATYCVFNKREHRCLGQSYTPVNQSDPDNVTACSKLATAQCPTEIYKFNIAVTDSTTGTSRAIKSKFAVGCKVFL